MLVNKPIPNLFQGVSQQPVALRLNTQAELQDNALSSIVDGLKKRPPTTHIAKIKNAPYSGCFVHPINRDAAEKYITVFLDGDLEVYDIAGNQKTVSFPNGKTYLNNATPATGFSCTTISDYTIVSNKSVTTAMAGTTAATNPTNVAYFYVAAAPAQHGITAVVDGFTGSASLTSSGGTQGGFASALAGSLGTALGGGYTVTLPHPDVIKVVKGSGSISSASCSDTYGGYAIRCINDGVQQYSHLPAKFETGFTITVLGDASNNTDNYYVKWTGSAYEETIKPGELTSFDAATLPHKLVRNGDGTFTFSVNTWTDRNIGEDATNQKPSFIGNTINDIFFYRNRLGFLSDENVILSKAGNFFTFWVDTVVSPLDSDPIDVAVSSTKVSILKHAVPFNTQLLLFSDLTQFMVSTSANVALTQKTININPTTQYQINSTSKPVGIGQDVYFVAERGSYSAVMEYYVQPMTYTNDAAEVTSHVQKYLPKNIYKLIGSSLEDSLFALSSSNPNLIYTYKFYWGDENKKVQSSWSTWTLDATDTILGGDVMDSRLYLVVQRSDGVYLEYIALSTGELDTGMGLLVHLDRKVYSTGSYNSSTNETTWTLPYSEANVQVVLGSGYTVHAGTILTTTKPSATTVRALGDYSGFPSWIGRPYSMRYRFTQFIYKDEKNIAVNHYALKMKQLEISFSNSASFRVEVTPSRRDTYSYKFTGNTLGVTTVLGAVTPTYTGTFKVPLMSDSDGLQVDIVNDSWLPCQLQAAEWNAKLSMNFKRV